MKRLLTKTMLAVTGLVGMLPATASAATMFNFSGVGPTQTTGNGTATIDFTSVTINGTTVNDGFVESYTYNSTLNTGVLSFSASNAVTTGPYQFGAGTLLTINESGTGNLLANGTSTFGTPVQLYAGVTSLTFDPTFAADLGTTVSPSVGSVTGSSTVADQFSGGQVSSTINSFTVPTPTPEPASFTMLGMALLSAGVFSARKKFRLNRSQD